MPRQSRIDAPGSLHHIICRGIERRKIFRNDADRDDFVERLSWVVSDTATSCYAWALMPNHFHMLLRTWGVPITTVMRRLLTGYAGGFNRRHQRSGHLFQNRYKSILCQEDPYLKELVRYIHLNPLRAKIVNDLDGLDFYRYCGHSRIMGNIKENDRWQDTDFILAVFGASVGSARKNYQEFMESGIAMGRRPELTGGGLVRSAGGWGELKSMRRMRGHMKGDERILGDPDYVESVLHAAQEHLEEKYRIRAKGYEFRDVLNRVSVIFDIPVERVLDPCRSPHCVLARSVAAFWAVRKLGMRGTDVGRQLGLTQSAVSRAVRRGEQQAIDNDFRFEI
jgi:REP element-mobilizing transposase RayT